MARAEIKGEFGEPGYVGIDYGGSSEDDPYNVFVVAREGSNSTAAWVKPNEFITAVEKVFNGKFVPNEIEED